MPTTVTKEELFVIIAKLKIALEDKINFIYLPLQRQMGEAESKSDFKSFVELECKIAPIREEIAKEYDQLLLVRDAYKSLVSQS